MKYNFEFGTPVHMPEEPNSLEKLSIEEYDKYFDELYEKQKTQAVDNNRINCRIDPEIYYEEVNRVNALELQLAISDRKSNELEQVNSDLALENITLEQKNLELEQETARILAKLIELEKINELLLSRLPADILSRNQAAQTIGQTASKLSF